MEMVKHPLRSILALEASDMWRPSQQVIGDKIQLPGTGHRVLKIQSIDWGSK